MEKGLFRFLQRVTSDDAGDFLSRISFAPSSYGLFRQEDGKASMVDDFSTPDFDLVYMAAGTSRITSEEGVYTVQRGGFFLIEPFKLYSAQCLPGANVSYYYAHFDIEPGFLRGAYLRAVTGGGIPLFEPGELPDFFESFSAMDGERGKLGFTAVLQSYLKIVSAYMMRARQSLLERQRSVGKPASDSDLSLLAQALEYVDEHATEPINLEKLSVAMGVSYSSLYKLFMRILHEPPSKYIMRRKLAAADRLLRQSGCTVTEAAGRLGFSSASHLSSQFKKYLGHSPSETPRR